MNRIARATFILSLCFFFACLRAKPILSPEFDTLTSKPAVVEKAIKMSLLGRGWVISSMRPGKVEAKYQRSESVANVLITYSGSRVAIKYVSSANLLYGTDEKGQAVIHHNYNNWVTNLEHDIQRNVASLM